ncbi:hypothetical protein [Virgisporangium aurantiacum]|uniref:Uncharacterized protein n=1 Tax=Virgisporangium aurantiacum TaxID=175570 RepID=A0A8J4E2V0_9ACTN|nr:hypothetical protein [Virgisporangium aurantiacum]GIJ60220.1 hypothetical protein Vau01_077360 [Virgisporangium aurantiacum]
MGYRVEVGPIIAHAVGRRSGQAVGLPALAALLLASFSIAFSIALFTAVAGLPCGGHPPLGAAMSGPGAMPAQAAAHGSADLDVFSGYLQATPAAESPGVFAVTAGGSGPLAPGAERHQRGRAPPHTG